MMIINSYLKRNQFLKLGSMFCVAILSSTLSFAQRPGDVIEAGPAKVGTAAAQFLQIGVSARAIGMAEAFVAIANDASATYYNPAGIANLKSKEFFVSQSKWIADINHYFGAFVFPIGSAGSLGLSFIVLATDDIAVRKPFIGETGENFRASEAALGLTYAKYLTDRFSVGGTVKWINEDYYNYGANVFAADIGTLYNTGFRDMKIGMSVTNFGPDFHFSNDATGFTGQNFPLPIHFRFGIALTVYSTEVHSITAAVDLNQPNDNLRRENFGLEYTWNDIVALRAGYKAEYDSENFSLGAGIRGEMGGHDGNIDFSWSDMDRLGSTTRFNFGFGF